MFGNETNALLESEIQKKNRDEKNRSRKYVRK